MKDLMGTLSPAYGMMTGHGAFGSLADAGVGGVIPTMIARDRKKSKREEEEAKKMGAAMKKGGTIKAKGGWIKSAIKKPGALRESLGVKKGEKIPAGKLAAAAKKPGKMGQRARLAQTLKGFKK
jgi:hypothetical protein